jgi:hypothetical protein
VLACTLLCLGPAFGQVLSLSVQPVDIEYSSSLEKLVVLSKDPNQLQLLNPATGIASAIPLPKEPTSLSVSPDRIHNV